VCWNTQGDKPSKPAVGRGAGCCIQNSTQTTTVIVSFGDPNITRQRFVLQLFFGVWNTSTVDTVIRQTYFLSQKHPVSRNFLTSLRIVKCFINCSKRFLCEVMFDNIHALCTWIRRFLHLHNFCAASESSGLDIKMAFNWLLHEGLGETVARSSPASNLYFVPLYVIVLGYHTF
jgi:hypothetical protein